MRAKPQPLAGMHPHAASPAAWPWPARPAPPPPHRASAQQHPAQLCKTAARPPCTKAAAGAATSCSGWHHPPATTLQHHQRQLGTGASAGASRPSSCTIPRGKLSPMLLLTPGYLPTGAMDCGCCHMHMPILAMLATIITQPFHWHHQCPCQRFMPPASLPSPPSPSSAGAMMPAPGRTAAGSASARSAA
jgi:hypothetical protein